MRDSWQWCAGMARVGSSKHSPGRRITFPSILPLFAPPSQPRSSPLEPVKEGEQLSTKPVLPSKNLYAATPVLVSFACCFSASLAKCGADPQSIVKIHLQCTACRTAKHNCFGPSGGAAQPKSVPQSGSGTLHNREGEAGPFGHELRAGSMVG